MFCARCGQPLPEGAAFCPSCGASVPRWSGPPAAATAAPATAPITLDAAGAAATVPITALSSSPAAATVETVRYGGFWRRLVAFIIDGLLIGAVMMPFGLGLGLAHLAAMMSGDVTPSMLSAMIATSIFVWFIRMIVSWIYSAGFESSRWQATPGKMLLGLKVTDLEGRRITFLRATGRALGKWLSGLLLGMGYVLVAFTDRKQGLHDLMARTLVRR